MRGCHPGKQPGKPADGACERERGRATGPFWHHATGVYVEWTILGHPAVCEASEADASPLRGRDHRAKGAEVRALAASVAMY